MPNAPQTQTILIIEDEKELRELYVTLLTEEGFKVTEAANGDEGLKLLRADGFDLVLLDIMLPGKDGFEILEILKNQPEEHQQPATTIVLLTNLSQDQTIARGAEYGVRGYLIKSDYDPQQFLDQIKEFFSNTVK